MTNIIAGIVGVLVATNQPIALSNLVVETTTAYTNSAAVNDPVEKEYLKILEEDDKAQDEIDEWLRKNPGASSARQDDTPSVDSAMLNSRIKTRLDEIKKDYEDFISRHPDHARIHVAYGAFLTSIGHEELCIDQYEKAIKLDPKLPAAYNQAAMYYAHRSPVKKAFDYYAKASELSPLEPLYYHNLGDVVYLFRRDAEEYYKIDEQQVFNKALALYEKARELDPNDFELATDLAESYYGIRPFRTEAALTAWTNALALASSEVEREGVYIHLARIHLNADRFAEAHVLLNKVNDSNYTNLKNRLLMNLDKREHPPAVTNAPTASIIATNGAPVAKGP